MAVDAPRLMIFDAIETLFSLQPVGLRLAATGASEGSLDLWFARLLRDAFGLTAAGGYAPFEPVARGALDAVLADQGIESTDEVADSVLGAFATLPAHDDARPALELAASTDMQIHVLTNGTRETTEKLLDRAGLDRFVDQVVTVHDAARWKPAPDPYLLSASLADVEVGDAALVAVHGWDICGARRAGLRTGWCERLEHRLAPALGPADVEGATLDDVVRQLTTD